MVILKKETATPEHPHTLHITISIVLTVNGNYLPILQKTDKHINFRYCQFSELTSLSWVYGYLMRELGKHC